MAELAQTHYEIGYLYSPHGSGAAAGRSACSTHEDHPTHPMVNHFKPFQIRHIINKKVAAGINTRREGPSL